MAAFGLLSCVSFTRCSFIHISNVLEKAFHNYRTLEGFLQRRGMGRYYPVPRHGKKWGEEMKPKYWPKRKADYQEQHLTPENRAFLKEIIVSRTLKPGESPLKIEPWPRGEWAPNSRRSGLIAKKIGIYPMWTADGKRVLTTLLQIIDNHVIKYHPPEVCAQYPNVKERFKGLGCLIVGAESADPQVFTSLYAGMFKEAGVMPKRKLTKFFVTPNCVLPPGTPLTVNHFRAGDYVDCHARSIGHGFQGVVKRWGFKGGPATHGNTKNHRRTGCIGAGSRKNAVWKGKKMPGMMGQRPRTILGLKILRINTKYNVLWVKGPAVPGHVHHWIYITDCNIPGKCSTEDNHPHFPTFYPGESSLPPEEVYSSDMHVFSNPTITYDDQPEAVAAAKK